jgi:predicted PilT family ATPase
MGSLPQVIDTVIFIKAGQVNEILTIEQVVKVPA